MMTALTNSRQNVKLVINVWINGCCYEMNFWKCICYTVDPYNTP